jgi:hypothetical protein
MPDCGDMLTSQSWKPRAGAFEVGYVAISVGPCSLKIRRLCQMWRPELP